MKTFKFELDERSYGYWYIEANTEEEAKEKWKKAANEGKIDFGNMEVYDTKETCFEVPEHLVAKILEAK